MSSVTITATSTYPVEEVEAFAISEGWQPGVGGSATDFVVDLIRKVIAERISNNAVQAIVQQETAAMVNKVEAKKSEIAATVFVTASQGVPQ